MTITTDDFSSFPMLVSPDPGRPDLVHVVRALATLCGADGLNELQNTQNMVETIGQAEHYIFVLLDGLGMNLVRRLPEDSFMKRHLRQEIRAVCPSTTACALTSVATASWPGEHGIAGWFTYLPERKLSITTLPFVDRFSGKSLASLDIRVEDVIPIPAFHTRLSYLPLTLLPSSILNTPYATFSRGGTNALGYTSIHGAVDQIIASFGAPKQRSYTHFYIPDIDTACHHHGIEDPGVMKLVGEIDSELERLAAGLNGRARIVISADHGLIDVPVSNHMSLFFDNPLMNLLEAPPSGDARLPVFHVKEGSHDEFVARFDERFGLSMKLLRTADADAAHLFAPGGMTPLGRRRFGDYVGVAIRNATLHYVPRADPSAPQTPPKKIYIAQHAGLSRDEMEIPLIIS